MSAAPHSSAVARERELFLAALEKPPAERAAFLASACGGDAATRSRVEELLREQEEVGGFLEMPALSGARESAFGPHDTAVMAAVTEKPGDRIGRYKLLQKIGEGGAGVVYMAEQEEPVRRRVALKVIKLGMDTRGVIARFEAERQALAMMDHANIARVFDAGATDAGRPFFVMELVRGVRITDYCDQNKLPAAERLKLFTLVCQAIQHAHQKGIIHRDIKPSNILVTLHDGVPVPKVIDFGIAKATEQRLTDKTLFTEFTAFIGTPAYMSPEQAEMSGLDIDTRSDIYSLGVLFYELLVGRTPFDAETLWRAGLDECRRTIREDEPLRPSTRLSTLVASDLTTTAEQRRTESLRLVHLLRGDLDWIAMKCLEKDRTRRYATANDLAEDIQRYLGNEPILARPPSNVYRVRKLLRRHRGAFSAAAAVAIAVLAGAGISAWQAVRATRAERAALASGKQESILRIQAERGRTSARLNEYVADINLALQSLDAGNYGRAVQLLDKHRPAAGSSEPDLRGFEWRYLWQRSRGDEHVSLPDQGGAIQSLAVSPSGELLVAGLSQKFTVWNLRTRAFIIGISNRVSSMVFLPDGRLITTGQNSVRVWNTAEWKEEKTLPDTSGPLALSADGARLATVGRDNVRVFDTATWTEQRRLAGAQGLAVFSPDGKSVVADTFSAGLTVWPLQDDGAKVVLQDSTNLFPRGPRFRGERPVAFSPDGQFIVAARNTLSERGVFVLSVWDARTGVEVATMPDDAAHIEHSGMITSIAFSPDGGTLATASMDYSVRLWDFTQRHPLAALQGHLSEVQSVAFSPDGQTLVSGSKDGEVKIWPAQPARKEEILTGVRHPLAVSKEGSRVVGLTRDGSSVVFLNLAARESEQQFELYGRRGRFNPFGPPPVAVSDDLRTLALGRDDGTVRVMDTESRETNTLKVGSGPVDFVALSPDGWTLITHGREGGLRQWDLRNGTQSDWPVEGSRALFSPDGRRLATLGRSDALQLWDAVALVPLTKIEFEEQPALGFTGFPVAFSPDGGVIAVIYQDDTIRLWETDTGESLGVCTGHKQSVRSVAFSPDGKTLVTASEDSTVKFWNAATQQELLTIRHLGAPLSGLLFSPDGRLLVGGSGAFSQSGGLRFFRAPAFRETDAPRPSPAPALARP